MKQNAIEIPLCRISFKRGFSIKIVKEIPCSEMLGIASGKEQEPGIWPASSAASKANGVKGPLAQVAIAFWCHRSPLQWPVMTRDGRRGREGGRQNPSELLHTLACSRRYLVQLGRNPVNAAMIDL